VFGAGDLVDGFGSLPTAGQMRYDNQVRHSTPVEAIAIVADPAKHGSPWLVLPGQHVLRRLAFACGSSRY
jgi:hypothetical protein